MWYIEAISDQLSLEKVAMHESIADVTNINLSAIKTGTSLDPVLVSSTLMCQVHIQLTGEMDPSSVILCPCIQMFLRVTC